MKNQRRRLAEESAAARILGRKLVLARARAATLEAAAHEAKADFKQAKKAHKHARKAAKLAKKEAKALARELKAAATKPKRRKKRQPALVARTSKRAPAAPAALPPAIADGGAEGAAGPVPGL